MTAVYGLKFVLVGDNNVGKSQLLRAYTKKPFDEQYQPTRSMEFGIKEIKFERCVVKAQIWDTAGQERPEKMSKAFYKDALGAVLIFDVGSKKSFDHLKSNWIPQIRRYGHENLPSILVGNKTDIASREVDAKEAISFAREFKMDYIETSALSGDFVEVAFRRIILHVASLLPAVKTHLELTNLPEGWIVASDDTTNSADRTQSLDATNSKLSSPAEMPIASSLPAPKMMPRRSITSMQNRKQSDGNSESPQLTPTSSASTASGRGADTFSSSFINYWTGEEVSERPSGPAVPPLLYDSISEEKRIETESRLSERASVSDAGRSTSKSTTGASTVSSNSSNYSNAPVISQAIQAPDRPMNKAKSVDIQQSERSVTKPAHVANPCFCIVM